MNKLFSILLAVVILPAFAQINKGASENHFEAQLGVSNYNFHNSIMPSLQIGFISAANEYISIGPFVNAYTTPNSSSSVINYSITYSYRTMGFRGGMLLRGSSNSTKSHIYLEIRGSIGRIYQTGLIYREQPDKATELLAGLHLGYNFKVGPSTFLGIYAGMYMGKFTFAHTQRNGIQRYDAGISYQTDL